MEAPRVPYLENFMHCLHNACDPVRNPTGHIGLCVAENKLILDVVAERLMQVGTATAAFSDSTVYCYNSFLGLPVARDAVAYFLAKRFYLPQQPNLDPNTALQHIRPQHVVLASGCAAVLQYLFFLIGEPGESCLIPAPYYAAFDSDMNSLAGIVPFPFQMANATLGPTEQDLNVAYVKATSQGLKPRFILLTNPNNPLGVVYPPQVLRDAVKWARKRNLHTIVDEIHALTRMEPITMEHNNNSSSCNNNNNNNHHPCHKGISKICTICRVCLLLLLQQPHLVIVHTMMTAKAMMDPSNPSAKCSTMNLVMTFIWYGVCPKILEPADSESVSCILRTKPL